MTTVACPVDASGHLIMEFCLPARGTQAMWAQCVFELVSLQGFDADWGNDGVLEVFFETSAPLTGSLKLFYGGLGANWPRRKSLPLATSSSLLAGPHRVLLRPSDARCALYSKTDQDPLPTCTALEPPTPAGCLPDACRTGCDGTPTPDAAGKWASVDPVCKFSYAGVPLWLTFESIPDNTPPQQARVTVTSIVYYPSSCQCAGGADCKDGVHTNCDLAVTVSTKGVCKLP
jgi:hypothetical protein